MRNVVLAVFAEVAAVGVNDGGGIEVDPGHLHFVDGDDEDHLIFLGESLHERDGWSVRDALSQFVPASLLLSAEVRAIEKLLETEDLHFFLGGVGDQALVLGDHFLLDVGERKLFRRPFTLRLNQATANRAGHGDTSQANAGEESTLCAGMRQVFGKRWNECNKSELD